MTKSKPQVDVVVGSSLGKNSPSHVCIPHFGKPDVQNDFKTGEDDTAVEYWERKLGLADKSADSKRKISRNIVENEFGGDHEVMDLIDDILDGTENSTVTSPDILVAPTYVSPAKRPTKLKEKAPNQQSKGYDAEEMKARLRSLLNRVSEGNLNVLLAEFLRHVAEAKDKFQLELIGSVNQTAIEEKTEAEFIGAIADGISDASLKYIEMKAGTSLTGPQTAMVCALSGLVHPRVGWVFAARLFKLFEDTLAAAATSSEDLVATDTLRQTVTSLCLTFYFGLMGAEMIMGFFRYVAALETERRAEFLCSILRLAGSQLKGEFPEHFEQMKLLAENAISTLNSGPATMNYLRHELENLGRERNDPMHEKLVAMKKWLLSKSGHFRFVMWDKVRLPDSDADVQLLLKGIVPSGSSGSSAYFVASEETPLFATAKRLHVKTPLQQKIFVTLMSASSLDAAVTAVLQLSARKKDIPTIVQMVAFCAGCEREYNPFYEELLANLCAVVPTGRKFQKIIRQVLHLELNSLARDFESQENDPKLQRRKSSLQRIALALSEQGVIKKSDSLQKKCL